VSLAITSLLLTWPLALHMHDHVLVVPYHWDAYTNTMSMGARVDAALGRIGVYEGYSFAPLSHTIALNENLFGLALLFAPFYLATGNPLLAHNATLLLSLAMSAYFTFLLVRRLSASPLAGLLAGVAFAFSPYAMFELGRIQLVATQWIPLFFLCLHRTAATGRMRDAAAMGLAFALQVGTCLQYALLMLPAGLLLAIVLLVRIRPRPLAFSIKAATVIAATGAAVLAMVHPYLFAQPLPTAGGASPQSFDGKLSFLLNVHPHNKLWTALHHVPAGAQGAHEEIAFPTFTIGAMCLWAWIGFWLERQRELGAELRRRRFLSQALYWALALAAVSVLTLVARSFLVGALGMLSAALGFRRLAQERSAALSPLTLWSWALGLTLVLFLGFSPLRFHDAPVRGLYGYVFGPFAGLDGMGKASRLAVMLLLCSAVIGGFGGAMLLRRLRQPPLRWAAFAALCALLVLELRSAPMVLASVPSVPDVYRFIANAAREGSQAPIAVHPADDGERRFIGSAGLALHGYLALFHGRRTLSGKSSTIPPVTALVHDTLGALPSSNAWRVLQLLQPQFLVVHGAGLGQRRAQRFAPGVESLPSGVRRVYERDGDIVYEMARGHDDPSLGLLSTPAIDEEQFTLLRSQHLHFTASRNLRGAAKATDADPRSRWSTGRRQRAGDWIEFVLDRRRTLGGFEFRHFQDVFEAPAAFSVQTSEDGATYQTLLTRPRLRFYRDQVHAPARFVFRVVLPRPVRARKLRLVLLEAVPARAFSIYEARLWTSIRPGFPDLN
jgi:hypothetical protein